MLQDMFLFNTTRHNHDSTVNNYQGQSVPMCTADHKCHLTKQYDVSCIQCSHFNLLTGTVSHLRQVTVFSKKTDVPSPPHPLPPATDMTLKIMSRSPKFNQFFVICQLYIHGNLVRIQPLVQKILC